MTMGNPVLRCATIGLIATVLTVILSSTWLISAGKQVPDGIVALASAAVGALATLMTTSSLDSHWSSRVGDATITRTVQEKISPPSEP